ncbi:glucans biosynthesis glucosyltransferase MdoH [Marivita sp. GX14005]|uniref:glucans biosynthesis glucosyltransferase MdoH n=1 Tax=Marivita sp. GX14005 TaxID=2942276 RepID=UPI0020193C9C|nr:glucans biosynthesis glucosyltransferase MdoH [Marivita sp. GX14005]MCL3883234.1 glucans biosynthesis glucosyltransferase MdoH [Marivita sp. GX14005]
MTLAETLQPRAIARPRHAARLGFLALTAAIALALTLAFAASVTAWSLPALAALALVGLAALWISGGAATALVGLLAPPAARETPPAAWRPQGRAAILVTLCNEPPEPLAAWLPRLGERLRAAGLGARTHIFVLSDTSGPHVAAEEAAFAPLAGDGLTYRRRARNAGRKPGNIADWLAEHGDAFRYMLVLDADSRMSARRIRQMIWTMEQRPALGLLQAGIALRPGQSRLGRHQRLSARLMGRNFGRGFAAWSGRSGNYWGHNALLRTAAFRSAADLPKLSGPAPFGGAPLSHDFIEAAWIRRAGWDVRLDPDPAGSAEDAPQTLAAFHKRDRRWCQGNLQHLRLIAEPGLHPLSRLHLASGILGYLAAPVWLALVALMASGAVQTASLWPLALVAFVLLLPKFCALAFWLPRARTWRRRVRVMRAAAGELALSSVIAPLVMLRQAGAVAAVCLGRDCGWKRASAPRRALPRGLPEAAAGGALLALAAFGSGGAAALWTLPLAVPLCAAPWLIGALDAPA